MRRDNNQINSSSNQFNQIRRLTFYDINQLISNSVLFGPTQNALIKLHNATGLTWYLEIILLATVYRTVYLFFIVNNIKILAKLEQTIEPETNEKLIDIQEVTYKNLQLRELRSIEEANKFFKIQAHTICVDLLFNKHKMHHKSKRQKFQRYGLLFIWFHLSYSICNLFLNLK